MSRGDSRRRSISRPVCAVVLALGAFAAAVSGASESVVRSDGAGHPAAWAPPPFSLPKAHGVLRGALDGLVLAAGAAAGAGDGSVSCRFARTFAFDEIGCALTRASVLEERSRVRMRC